jgi:hypothetical protein
LLRFFNHIRDLGLEQMQEDRAAQASVQAIELSAEALTSVSPARD